MNKFRKRLAEMGLVEPVSEWFLDYVARMTRYMEENDGRTPPQTYACEDGYKLGSKTNSIRTSYRRGTGHKLTSEMIRMLDDIGFPWNGNGWFKGVLRRLIEYKAEHGHCAPPGTHVHHDGYKLGKRVQVIRSGRRGIGSLKVTSEMVEQLDAIGFVWDACNTGKWWPEFYAHIKAVLEKYPVGHIPKDYVCPDGYKLGEKASHVRCGRRGKGFLQVIPEMIAKLDALGFLWVVPR